MAVKIAASADIGAHAQIGEGSQILHLPVDDGDERWSCHGTATVHEAVDATLREVV